MQGPPPSHGPRTRAVDNRPPKSAGRGLKRIEDLAAIVKWLRVHAETLPEGRPEETGQAPAKKRRRPALAPIRGGRGGSRPACGAVPDFSGRPSLTADDDPTVFFDSYSLRVLGPGGHSRAPVLLCELAGVLAAKKPCDMPVICNRPSWSSLRTEQTVKGQRSCGAVRGLTGGRA